MDTRVNNSTETTPEQLAAFFSALASPVRIRIISILNLREACLEELSTMLERKPATIHHHLSKLTAIGLVSSEKRQYYRYYSLKRERWGQLHSWLKQALQFNRQLEDYESDFRKSVFANAFREGRFGGFPPQQRDRELLQRFFIGHLQRERSYELEELSQVFSEYCDDIELILKPLQAAGLLRRQRNSYSVVESSSNRKSL